MTLSRLFAVLGVDDSAAHRFIIVPSISILAVVILEFANLLGATWVSPALAPPALLALAILNAAWASVALWKGGSSVSLQSPTRINVGLHEAWRARTVAWGALALAVGAIAVVLVSWAGPGRIIPTYDVPFLEIVVLALTATLLAIFARYTVMAFSTDVDSVVRSFESSSMLQQEERAKEAEKLGQNFSRNVDRLLTRIDDQSRSSERSLATVAAKLDAIAAALAEQLRIGKDAAEAARKAAEAQLALEAKHTADDLDRRRQEYRSLLDRVERIRPVLRFRLYVEGIVFHTVFLEILATGPKTTAVLATILHSNGKSETRSVSPLQTGVPANLNLGDVTGFNLETKVEVSVVARDEDSNPYQYLGSFTYHRAVGFWGQTRGILIAPNDGLEATRKPLFQPPPEPS